ncbi:hypothetical protein EDM56_21340 [Brevibacillus fluminis]|uniref:Uncharacterized protein n=1 Tax=Brevibacillus fluminis TaxID=511487 RepID=A0A3M8DAN2_9BACL|nr:hypothetical protein EDM56_21340 [Brevibacillus fluminis]
MLYSWIKSKTLSRQNEGLTLFFFAVQRYFSKASTLVKKRDTCYYVFYNDIIVNGDVVKEVNEEVSVNVAISVIHIQKIRPKN